MEPAAAEPSNWVRESRSSRTATRSRKPGVERRKPFGSWLLLSDTAVYVALFLITLAVYAQTIHFDFVNYDDPEYVSANPRITGGLTAGNIAWAFTSTEAANWFPVTRLSHLLDFQFFGLESGWHHLTNVVLHALAALLLFAFLRRASGARWPSAFVAFIFALHPLHVESVAWISERKDVLSALFWFLTLWAYTRYTERPSARRYAVVVASFCLGLMSKPMIVTLPILLLLLDMWPLRRRPALNEKLPLFALSGAVALITYLVQQHSGAVRSFTAVPLPLRIENALVSLVVYIVKTVWPANLAVFYPYRSHIPAWETVGAAIALAGVTIAVLRQRGERPFLAVGWLWYLVTLAPVIGLVQVGAQARADRYTYVPMIGLLIMLAYLRPVRPAVWAAVVACCACVPVAWAQIGYWRSSETLFQHALAVTPDNSLAEHNLGSALLDEPGRLPDAVAHLKRAVQLDPKSLRAHTDLGSAYAKLGRFPEAIAEFRAALAIDPQSAVTRHNLETALSEQAEAHTRRGLELAREPGHSAEAIAELQAALEIRPGDPETHNNLGVLLSQIPGRSEEAIAQFRQALRLRPDYPDATYNLALALADSGRTPLAIQQLKTALQLHPDAQLQELLNRLQHGR